MKEDIMDKVKLSSKAREEWSQCVAFIAMIDIRKGKLPNKYESVRQRAKLLVDKTKAYALPGGYLQIVISPGDSEDVQFTVAKDEWVWTSESKKEEDNNAKRDTSS